MKQKFLCSALRLVLGHLLLWIAALVLSAPMAIAELHAQSGQPPAQIAKMETAQRDFTPAHSSQEVVGQTDSNDPSSESKADSPPDWVLTHGPYTHWYPDTTQLVKNRNTAGNQQSWKDVIGPREFDTKGIAVQWEGRTLRLAIFTNFPDRNVMAAGRTVAPADLALDMDGNGTLETGVVISGVRSTGDKGVERPAHIQRAKAYRVTKWLRPDDILAHTYGQGWRWVGVTGQELAYAAVPVWVGNGTARRDLDVVVDWRVNGHGSDYVVFVTLTKTNGDGELWDLPVIWGTAVCGNDVVFAPVARSGDLLEKLERNQEVEEGNDSADAQTEKDATVEGEAGGVPDAEVVNNGTFGKGAGEDGAAQSSEIVTAEVSGSSDEPTWNTSFSETFPSAVGAATTGGGAGGSGGGSHSGTSEDSGGDETADGAETAGGTEPESTPAPESAEGGESGGTEHATQISGPPILLTVGTALSGYAAILACRRRSRRTKRQARPPGQKE